MINFRFIAVLILAFTVTGCSTVVVDRSSAVSITGKAYIEALKKVNDLALDASIDFAANLLPELPRTEETLELNTEDIRKRTLLVGSAHEYFNLLALYFTELELLAKGEQSEATSTALGEVVDSLKLEPITLKLSDEKKKAITGLAGYVAKQIHAASIEKALIRDADTIAHALAITEQMLDEQIHWIKLREDLDRKKIYAEIVKKQFIAGGKLGVDWKKAWSNEVRNPPVMALLLASKKASQEMQKAWIVVLKGEYSHSEIHTSLKNVKVGLESLIALKDAK